ncbi:MAG TPA: tol-pal system protein YbgF [Burkholderiales bacterium]|jgi:tol-pal system protein YbgF|nr:tol-pal system protein YbgF [Burkholderiales bacterium]
MRFPAAAVLAPLFSLLTAVPCFAQGLFDDNEARRRVEALRQQLLEQNRLMEERMTKMETALAGASDRSAMLDIASQIEALRGDIAKMRGQLEVATNQIEVADKRQKDLYLDIDTRIRKLEQANEQAALLQQQQQQQAQPPGGTQPAESQQAGEMRAYQAALDQFKLGNYPLAVSAMQGFLVTYPNSSLAPNAQYWIGMAHSGQRDYKSAIAAQRKLLASWPESEKAPDALLSIASSQETMGDRRNAQKTLEEVIQRYPKSSAAASAKQRLAASKKG